MKGSRETLQSTAIDPLIDRVYDDLWEIHFPRLRSLIFGTVRLHDEPPEPAGFRQFGNFAPVNLQEAISADLLPKLRKFRGNSDIFQNLFYETPNCLKSSRETLELTINIDEADEEVLYIRGSSSRSSLTTSGSLTLFKLSIFDGKIKEIATLAKDIARNFPNVEVYCGPIPREYRELLEFAASLSRLKELHVCTHHIWVGECESTGTEMMKRKIRCALR
jgi:hypothetical protein